MRRRGRLIVIAALVLPMTIGARPAAAEWFVDLYLGGAFTAYHDLTAQFGPSLTILEDVEHDASVVFGGRVGYWFESPLYDRLHVGLALDGSWFEPNIDSQTVFRARTAAGVTTSGDAVLFPIDVTVIASSIDLMLRWPVLPTPEFPRGRLQPYLAIGPALFFTEAEDSGNFAPANQSDSDTSVGVKVALGIAFHLSRNLALVGESRYTYLDAEWDFSDGGGGGTLETDLNTIHLLVGLSYRF